MILLIASATPVIIFLYLLTQRDKRPEPLSLLAKCFLGGFLVAIVAIIIELFLGAFSDSFKGPLSNSIYSAFVIAAGTEEFVKWFVLRKIVWKNKEFDQYYDGIIYAVFVSLGFAFIENLMYVNSGGLHVAFVRAILSVPGHGFFAVIMGFYLSLAKFGEPAKREKYLQRSLWVPILFHGLFDFCLMYMEKLTKIDEYPLLVLALVILFTFTVIRIWVVGIRYIKLHLKTDGM